MLLQGASARKPGGRAAVVEISAVASLDAVLRSLNTLRVGGHPVTASRMAAPVEVVNSLQALEDEHEAHLVATVGADGEVRRCQTPFDQYWRDMRAHAW